MSILQIKRLPKRDQKCCRELHHYGGPHKSGLVFHMSSRSRGCWNFVTNLCFNLDVDHLQQRHRGVPRFGNPIRGADLPDGANLFASGARSITRHIIAAPCLVTGCQVIFSARNPVQYIHDFPNWLSNFSVRDINTPESNLSTSGK